MTRMRILRWVGAFAVLVSAAASPCLAAPQPAPPAAGAVPEVTGSIFRDPPPPGHWAAEAVGFLADLNIFKGYPDTSFGGRRAVNRYEFAVVLQRLNQQIDKMIARQIPAAPPAPAPRAVPGAAPPSGVSRADIEALARGNEQLRRDVDELRRIFTDLQTNAASLRRDVDDLREMIGTVQPKPR
jgi:hypothetical protein